MSSRAGACVLVTHNFSCGVFSRNVCCINLENVIKNQQQRIHIFLSRLKKRHEFTEAEMSIYLRKLSPSELAVLQTRLSLHVLNLFPVRYSRDALVPQIRPEKLHNEERDP